jgi:hypothetical protein
VEKPAQLHGLAVGEPYIAGRNRFPEAVQYSFRGGQHELLFWIAEPTDREILDIRRGDCEFALFEEQGALWFLYRFGKTFGWSDAPFSIWRVAAHERQLPEPGDESRALLLVILVDAATGIVRGLRAVSLSRALTAALHRAISAQLAIGPPASEKEEGRRIAEVYERYPDVDAMVRAAVARCRGGVA